MGLGGFLGESMGGAGGHYSHSNAKPRQAKPVGIFFMDTYQSTLKLYSDTLVSVMANSTPP